jgi:hypothetical protein
MMSRKKHPDKDQSLPVQNRLLLLGAIIAVGYRVRSPLGTQFRYGADIAETGAYAAVVIYLTLKGFSDYICSKITSIAGGIQCALCKN